MPKLTFYRKQFFGSGYALFDPGYTIELSGHDKKTLMPNSQVELEVPVGNSEITIRYRKRIEKTSINADENDFYYIKISPYKYQHRVALVLLPAIVIGTASKSPFAYAPVLAILAYIVYHTFISKRIYLQIFKNNKPDY